MVLLFRSSPFVLVLYIQKQSIVSGCVQRKRTSINTSWRKSASKKCSIMKCRQMLPLALEFSVIATGMLNTGSTHQQCMANFEIRSTTGTWVESSQRHRHSISRSSTVYQLSGYITSKPRTHSGSRSRTKWLLVESYRVTFY